MPYSNDHTRIDVLQLLQKKRNYRRYLEIGCQGDVCFSQIEAEHKVGVDPVSGGTHRMTSDAYFADLAKQKLQPEFDLIFIDGDHHHNQVWKDVQNALAILAPKGALVMHDCLPLNRAYEKPTWSGTAWRAYAKLRTRPTLEAFVGDFDHGVGLIRFGSNTNIVSIPQSLDKLTYDDFVKNRERWMRPVSFEQIEKIVEEGW